MPLANERGVAFWNVGGRKALVLPAVDHLGKLLGRPALVVNAVGLDQLLDQAHDIVGIQDGERGFQAHQFGMAAQKLHADRMERAHPRHAFDGAADENADALLHLAGRLVGEGDGEDLRGEGAAGGKDMGDAGGEHAGLAGAGAGQHQNRAVERFHRFALLGIEAGEIVWNTMLIARLHGAGCDAACGCRRCRLRAHASLRARRRLLVKEGDIVKTIAHAAQCSDSEPKGQNSVLLLFQNVPASLWRQPLFGRDQGR